LNYYVIGKRDIPQRSGTRIEAKDMAQGFRLDLAQDLRKESCIPIDLNPLYI